jgi:hypothetical protein
MHSRFSSFPFDGPPAQSVADKLLADAHQLEIKLVRHEGGVTACIELHASLGAELFGDDDADPAEQSRKSYEALADVRTLLGAFAAAGSRGDA